MGDLTLENLTRQAREDGWTVMHTTNVHLDRADVPGTGAVLVECFDEHGNPGYFLPGADKSEMVCIAGDKLNDRPFASTVAGVLEWARYTFDSPNEPLPALFLEADDQEDWTPYNKLFQLALQAAAEEVVDLIDAWMVDRGWAERSDDNKIELTALGLQQLEKGDGK